MTSRASIAAARCPWVIVLALVAASARAHETDQFSVPLGREFADLRYHFSDDVRQRLERAVERLNERIDRARRSDPTGARARRYESPDAVARAVFAEFPNLVLHVESIELALRDPKLQARYPGLLLGHQPFFWIYHHPMLIIDVLKFPRYWRTSTVMIDGTYLGTDKIVHFVHMGYIYFQDYRRALARGLDEQQALDRVINVGGGLNVISENVLLGGLSTGVRSNADLAADYAGLKFYRNLTEPVRLEGRMHPPLLEHDGVHWRLGAPARPGRDFFSRFVTDHWDEALNPNTYVLGVGIWVRDAIEDRCEDALTWYCEQQGLPRTRERFIEASRRLTTYFGENYGHQGDVEEMIGIANCCFSEDDRPATTTEAGHPSDAAPRFDVTDAYAARLIGFREDDRRPARRLPAADADPWGRNELWWAARDGDAGRIASMIAADADVRVADVDGETPLHWAARRGHADAARALLEGGAEVDAQSWLEETPLIIAARESHLDLMRVLLDADAGVDRRDGFGRTALHGAASRGGVDAVRMLIAAGANPMVRDDFGVTALHLAARAGHVAASAALVDADADPDVRNRIGHSPADEARLRGHEDITAMLHRSRGIARTGKTD